MHPKRHDFPEERDTQTDVMPSARPPPSAADPPALPRPTSTWRPKPIESTTYAIVARDEARPETLYTPPPDRARADGSSRPPKSRAPRSIDPRSEPPLRGYEAPIYESGAMPVGRNAMPPPLPPREVTDDELTARQRTWIDQIHGALDAMTHYELLGIAENAERDVVRQAYFSRVSTYHPDRFFGKRTGAYARKLQTIFSRINEAYASLRDADARAAYDAWLAAKRKEERAVRSSRPDR